MGGLLGAPARLRGDDPGVRADPDPDPSIAYAAAVVGDRPALDAYLRSSQARRVEAGRPQPWTVDDSGFRASAAQVGLGR
ncbi:MAG: hypothetical protein EKK42_26110 [Pseudonocardiaceae bacterium]|nr:MAG: hypothetical protein EKK42_26110 [Pseudonocardiaceae bacterium]